MHSHRIKENIYTVESLDSIIENEIIVFSGKWMQVDIIVLREINQIQKG
jgi:hypothetical protein